MITTRARVFPAAAAVRSPRRIIMRNGTGNQGTRRVVGTRAVVGAGEKRSGIHVIRAGRVKKIPGNYFTMYIVYASRVLLYATRLQ